MTHDSTEHVAGVFPPQRQKANVVTSRRATASWARQWGWQLTHILQTVFHPPRQFKQLLQLRDSGPGGGKLYPVMGWWHDYTTLAALARVLTSIHRALQPLEKIHCMLVGDASPHPPSVSAPGSLCWFAIDLFAMGLHTSTAVARLP